MSALSLVLLRGTAGAVAVAQACALFAEQIESSAWAPVIATLSLVGGIAFIAGWRTLISGAILAVTISGIIFLRTPFHAPAFLTGFLAPTLVLVIVIAIMLMGPGAWSIDAWRFGLRTITVPREPPS
ncbi:MAG TPA: hypothetical protein VMB85_05750 [Bryobacteraceae bacterium]|nr:hypothetical protein [Bryobacteraceae bacterium]